MSKLKIPFPSLWKSILDIDTTQVEIQKLVSQEDYERINQWAKDRADTGVLAYINNLEYAAKFLLEGHTVEEILSIK